MPRIRDIEAGAAPRKRGRPKKRSNLGSDPVPLGVGDEMMTTEEAAAFTKMSKSWFVQQRQAGSGPPFHKRGRTVRYLKSELAAWWTSGA